MIPFSLEKYWFICEYTYPCETVNPLEAEICPIWVYFAKRLGGSIQ